LSNRISTPIKSHIVGTGHYVPERRLTNRELEAMVDTSDAWIVERTGISERRVAREGETTSDMAANAARRALEDANLSPKDIDMIIVATVTPDLPLPSTAVLVQQKLGARSDCPGFDLAAACTGFIYGLSIANQFVSSGAARHVLVIGAELLSRFLDWSDRTTCVLFGDGAGAVVVGPAPAGGERGIRSVHLFADGTLAPSLYIPAGGSQSPASVQTVQERMHYVRMDGPELFKVAVKNLASCCQEALKHHGMDAREVSWVFAHQANRRILEGVASRTGIPWDRFYLNIQKYGNTSSASVPIALDEAAKEKRLIADQNLVLCALGGGITWGSASIRW